MVRELDQQVNSVLRSRKLLQLYASFTSNQKQMLPSETGLPCSLLKSEQWQLAVQCLGGAQLLEGAEFSSNPEKRRLPE